MRSDLAMIINPLGFSQGNTRKGIARIDKVI